jgi:hypothetical protein
MRSEMQLKFNDSSNLETRIAEFKNDPDKMQDITKFIDDILFDAQQQAQAQEDSKTVSFTYLILIRMDADCEQIFFIFSRLTIPNYLEMVSNVKLCFFYPFIVVLTSQ